MPPKAGTTPKKKEAAKGAMAPVNEGITWVASDQFPSDQRPGTSCDNPVHLSDATDASASGSRPRKDDDFDDEAKLLGHFSDTLCEMATSIVDLEDGYFRALHEVIVETERALRDVSRIDTHYVSQVVTVMSSWQEAVQTAASHMEGVDTTIYLARREDAQRATREYVAAVVKTREERDAAHVVEGEARRRAVKDDDQRPCSPSSARHPNSGPRPVREGHRRLPVQHREDPPEARARARTRALDIECLEHRIPVPNECVAYDRRGVHSPGAGKAL